MENKLNVLEIIEQSEKIFEPSNKRPKRFKETVHVNQVLSIFLLKVDQELIGTPYYMGKAYFWNYEYRHTLRNTTELNLINIHDELLSKNIPLDGISDIHKQIIEKHTKNCKRLANAF